MKETKLARRRLRFVVQFKVKARQQLLEDRVVLGLCLYHATEFQGSTSHPTKQKSTTRNRNRIPLDLTYFHTHAAKLATFYRTTLCF